MRFVCMTCYYRDSIRVVDCDMGIDEDEEVGDNFGQRKFVGEKCPRVRIRIKDDSEQ